MPYTIAMDHRYRKFLAVAETGSFSGAAKKLRVSQPAVTLAVASLERALGVKLYIRRHAPIELTEHGELVAETARRIAAEIETMRVGLRQEIVDSRYQVGLIDSIAHLLYTTDAERPLLNGVETVVDNSRRILRDLTEGKIDLGVITGQPTVLGPDVAIRKLHNEEFVFVTAPYRTLTKVTSRIDDWLATNPDSTTYQHFLALFRRKGLQVTPIFHSASMELLRDMALNGRGTALLPRHIVQHALDDGTLVVVRTKPLYRPIWAVTRTQAGGQTAGAFAAWVNLLLSGNR
jgi:DNA-binding transcriptional LysR family regulator